MPRQRHIEEQREKRKTPPVPWEHRQYIEQRRLTGITRMYGMTEEKALVRNYRRFCRRFHREKGTWPQVRCYLFHTEAKAIRYVEILTAELDREDQTTATALVEYRLYLKTKDNKTDSIRQTCWAIEQFFPDAIVLSMLSEKRCAKLYEEMRVRKTKTGDVLSVDSHRRIVAQAKTFSGGASSWLRENPAAKVKGVGKRRPRGKSLGKSGVELHIKGARAWYQMAIYLAHRGDQGAIAALVAVLLGMRASEITASCG